jgi:hypothetical protein
MHSKPVEAKGRAPPMTCFALCFCPACPATPRLLLACHSASSIAPELEHLHQITSTVQQILHMPLYTIDTIKNNPSHGMYIILEERLPHG